MCVYIFFFSLLTTLLSFYCCISETAVEALMGFLRINWPSVNIPPKLHMLEDHVSTFIRKWRAGLGFYGEQGGESVHNEFNKLYRTYCAMKPNSRRLISMVKEHHRRIHPSAKALRPCKKARENTAELNEFEP